MRSVEWTQLALDDLDVIDEWLEQQANDRLSLAMVLRIKDRADSLAEFSHKRRPHGQGNRILRVYGTPYLIRYRIVADTVQVLRVHHERQDWSVDR